MKRSDSHDDAFRAIFADYQPEEPSEPLLASLEQRLHQRAQKQKHHPWRVWTGWAAAMAAAMVAIAMLWPSPSVSFAGMLAKVERVGAIACRARLIVERGDSRDQVVEAACWFDRELGVRTDLQMRGERVGHLVALWHGPVTLVDDASEAVLPLTIEGHSHRILRQIAPTALVTELRLMSGGQVEELGKRLNASGKTEQGFALAGHAVGLPSGSRVEVWVDPRTRLPVEVEAQLTRDDHQRMRLVIDQFQWTATWPHTLFAAELPEGYRQYPAIEVPKPSEDVMVRVLARFAQLTGGRFPTGMAPWQVMSHLQIFDDPKVTARLLAMPVAQQTLGEVVAGGAFYLDLVYRRRRPAYFGDRVRWGMKDEPLMQWETSTGELRVLYGDLHRETLSAAAASAEATP